MEISGQLNHNLHGYRASHSTTTALLQLSDTILQATDSNLISTLITVDESAAFDCVNFENLLKKLEMYKFGPKSLKWIKNYLTGRLQYVEIGTKKSDTMLVSRGIPQGSILGPLFYTIYTNKLPESIQDEKCENPTHGKRETLFGDNCRKCGSVPSFADDATFVVETKDRVASQEKIEKAAENIQNFLNSQDLVVNLSKTMLLESMVKQKKSRLKGTQPSLSTLMETGEPKTIHPGSNIRLLGVNLEQNLAWNSHLLTGEKAVIPACRKQLGSLRYISHQIPRKSRLVLANGLIISRILYDIALWGVRT